MTSKPSNHFRVDIQALRTVAVLLVVVFHFWPKLVTGGFIGVDVFFVISGFLITSHILRDVDRGQFSIVRFWARRARRLLPASFTVLVATAGVVLLFVPMALWSQWLNEIIASVFYFENWVLAANAVDYLALSNTASPTQHFWSLGVEEQFYIAWPLLIALALAVAPKLNQRARRFAMFAILLIITLASLVFGIFDTAAEPAVAYFSTPVRVWEFGIGALVAFMPSLSAKRWSWLISVAGFAVILAAGFRFTTKIEFPGYFALVPVVGTAAVIIAGGTSGAFGKVLGFAPIQFIGDRSYSIYLWHWPILVLAPYVLHSDALSTKMKIALVALSILLAHLSAKFIEKPLMSNGIKPNLKPRFVFAFVLASSLVISGSTYFALQSAAKPIADNLTAANSLANSLPKCFGALAIEPAPSQSTAGTATTSCVNSKLHGLYPSLDAANADSFFAKANCALPLATESKPKMCELGIRGSKIRIAMLGDSHIAHYSGAIDRLAKLHGWAVDVYAKGRCPFTDAMQVGSAALSPSCQKFIPAVLAKVLAGHYDLVVTSRASVNEASTPLTSADKVALQQGLVSIWQRLTSAGIGVVVIKDSPRPVGKVLTCLGHKSIDQCSIDEAKSFKYDPQAGAVAAAKNPLVTLVNLDRFFCSNQICKPVIGHVIVYKDANHLTNTYVKTLSPFIEPYLVAALVKAKLGAH